MSVSPSGSVFSTVGIVSVCVLWVFSTFSSAYAENELEGSVPESAGAGSTVPRLRVPEYRSPLSAYQAFEDPDPLDWKKANDRVGEIGGWRVYSREAFESEEANDQDADSR